jgi:lysophospholipase L1-like esterase
MLSVFLRSFMLMALNPMRALLLISFWLVVAKMTLLATAGDRELPTMQPVARTDENSRIAHEQLVEKARKGGIDIYFEGDSITRRWGASDASCQKFLANWTTNFFGWNAGNFGWGGDNLQNILWRLAHGELDGVNPKVIVLLAGTNNLGRRPPPGGDEAMVQEVVRGIGAILDLLHAKAPGAVIILTGITPRNDGGTAIVATINRINARLATFAAGKRIRYLDINDQLADPNGKLVDGMTVDRLHLSVRGYQIWADALKPVFRELLGPPARTDHAPPPTGDPSANRTASRPPRAQSPEK